MEKLPTISLATRIRTRIINVLMMSGFEVLVPLVRLCGGEEPGVQARKLAHSILVPMAAIAAFLVCWQLASANVKTSIGNLPGPRDVWVEGANMLEAHRAEKLKEAAFYVRVEENRKVWESQFPDRTFKAPSYTGNPTYPQIVLTSLYTVFFGFLIASLIAVPIGILCGLSKTFMTAVSPLIQIFKPVSPLAWLPIVMIVVSATYVSENPMFQKSFITSAIVVSLCSLWTTLINTALGVASIDPDHLNVARVLKLGWFTRVTKIVIPSALPLIFTGLRLSLGVGWMVLIAAEMLAQNPGLGKFVWDVFQNGSSQTLAQIMVAVFTIGLIGFGLDRIMFTLQRLVSFSDDPVSA